MRKFFAALSMLGIILISRPAGADLADYDPTSDDWTGMSAFVELADEMGIEIEVADTLDFRALDPDRPLIVVYPQQPLEVPNFARYIVDGGRVLLADDFGESDEFLARLEIQRMIPEYRNLPHDTYVNDNPSLPLVRSRGRHPLLEGVEAVMANHPSVVSNVGGAILTYDGGGGLVYDMNLGEGKAIVVGDSSMFINHMLGEADNEAFAANALRYICRDAPGCRPILVTRRFEQRGSYDDTGLDIDVGSLDELNEAIDELVASLPSGELLYWLSLILAFGLAVYMATIFPIRRTRPYSAYVTDFLYSVPSPQSEYDWNVSRFGRGPRTMNFALPMAILKEIFEELFLTELGYWESGDERPSVTKLADEFVERYGARLSDKQRDELHDDVVRLLGAFANIPPRSRVFLDSDANITHRELLEHHARAMEVLKTMGLHDEYQRRTRGTL